MSPLLDPITIPAFGVNPIVVSTHLPSLTALILPPLPIWQTITLANSLSSKCITLSDTYLWLIPWNPYFLTPYFVYHSSGTAYLNLSSFIVWWNAVSKQPTWIALGISFINARTPEIFAGLCNGASSFNFEISSNISSFSTSDLEYLSAPWTILWPTPFISSNDSITLFSNNSFINIFTASSCEDNVASFLIFSPLIFIV